MGERSAGNSRAAIRAHQERVLIERGRLCLWGTIAAVLVLWVLGASRLLEHTGSPVPLLNSIELCILTVAVTLVHRPWARRHVCGLSTAMCVQLVGFLALYGLWTRNLWLLSLRMSTLNLITAAVLPWGIAAQGAVMATSTLAFALVHWNLNGTLDHPSMFPTLVLFVFSLPLAFLLEQAHAQLASEIEQRQTAESALRRATESARVAVWSTDLRTLMIRFVSGWKRLLGRDESEITLAELWNLVHPDDRRKATSAVQEHLQRHADSYETEQRMLHADGSYRWVVSRGLVACDAAGRPCNLLGADIDITERKQLEEALRRSEEQYRQLVEDISDTIYAVDATGTVTYVSPIVESLYGYAPAEIVNRPFTDFVPADDVPRVTHGFTAALSGRPDLQDHQIVTKTGDIRWVRNSTRRVTDGRDFGLRGVLTDVTDRRRIEDELRALTDELDMRVIERTRQLYQALDQLGLQGAALEAAPDAVAVSDHQGYIQWINPAFTRLTGYGSEEVVGQTFRILKSNQHDSTFYRHLRAMAAAGEVCRTEIVNRRKDGSLFPAELVIAPVRNTHGALTHHVVIQCDISARKQAEQALRQQSHRNKLLLQTASDGIHILDADGRVVEVNAAFCAMLGYSADELAHMWVGDWDAQWTEPELRAHLRNLLERPAVFESKHRRKDGTTIDVEISTTAVDIDGETLLYASARDITQRKRAQEASAADHARIVRELEQANRLKSDFMATMSHELRTPLNIIMGYNALLLEEAFGSLNPDQADTMQRTQKRAEELLELIEATLNVSRLETDHSPLHPEEADVEDLVRALAAETTHRYDKPTVAIVCDVSPQLPRIRTDVAKLKLVLKNLLSNAMKFTAEGRVTVSACQRDSGVEITVSDTGIGIRSEVLPIIFEPFRQGESGPSSGYGGVGLGLYIVSRLVELLAGTVTVDSEVGCGSAFHVWLALDMCGDQRNR